MMSLMDGESPVDGKSPVNGESRGCEPPWMMSLVDVSPPWMVSPHGW